MLGHDPFQVSLARLLERRDAAGHRTVTVAICSSGAAASTGGSPGAVRYWAAQKSSTDQKLAPAGNQPRQIRRILEQDQQIEICAEAEDGAEAVLEARKYRPDLVLMDVFMPALSGLAAVREIRKTQPHVPVLVFTLYDSGGIRAESKKAAADAFLAAGERNSYRLFTIYCAKMFNLLPIRLAVSSAFL